MSVSVVLDINILASAAVFPKGLQGFLVALGMAQRFELVVSHDMVQTLIVVLGRPYFVARTTPERRDRYVSALRNISVFAEPEPSVSGVADDEEDDIVLGTAVAAGAEYLVTGEVTRGCSPFAPTAVSRSLPRGSS